MQHTPSLPSLETTTTTELGARLVELFWECRVNKLAQDIIGGGDDLGDDGIPRGSEDVNIYAVLARAGLYGPNALDVAKDAVMWACQSFPPCDPNFQKASHVLHFLNVSIVQGLATRTPRSSPVKSKTPPSPPSKAKLRRVPSKPELSRAARVLFQD